MNDFKKIRIEVLEMTQQELANLWGCSLKTIQRYEKKPNIKEILYLKHLAQKYLGVVNYDNTS